MVLAYDMGVVTHGLDSNQTAFTIGGKEYFSREHVRFDGF